MSFVTYSSKELKACSWTVKSRPYICTVTKHGFSFLGLKGKRCQFEEPLLTEVSNTQILNFELINKACHVVDTGRFP